MSENKKVYYVVRTTEKFKDHTFGRRPRYEQYSQAGEYGREHTGASTRDIEKAQQFPTVAAARVRAAYLNGGGWGDGWAEVAKVTETTLPGTAVRREVPLGTEGSKVAIKLPEYILSLDGVQFVAGKYNSVTQGHKIEGARLFHTVREALTFIQDAVSTWKGSRILNANADLVGILEETTPARIERAEEVVPEPVEPNFTRRVTIVGSSVIKEAAYAPAELVLEVVFNDGKAYRYGKVYNGIFMGLIGSSSAGRYYSTHIRNQFPRVD